VEAKIERKSVGLAEEVVRETVPVGPDGRWTFSTPLDPGEFEAFFRTRTDYGAYSPWIQFAFNRDALPDNLTMLTKGYDGYLGTSETYINLWDPAANFQTDKLLKVRSGDIIKSLIQFDLSQLDGLDATQVRRAGLVFWTEDRTNLQSMELQVFPLASEWAADEATWLAAQADTPWTVAGAASAPDDFLPAPTSTTSLIPDDWAVIDVTEMAQGWFGGIVPQEGFLLSGTSPGAVQYSLGDSDHSQPGFRPILFIEWNQ
jgi:hypothetical protein